MSKPVFNFYGHDGESIADMHDDKIKVEWSYIGEGLCGDFDPNDPDDVELLRFDVYRFVDGDWEYVEDSSYCTQVPLCSSREKIEATLRVLFERFSDALQDPYASVKKLGEELSWIGV